jgi:uncharacterized protein (TIGR02246 family)
MGPRVFPLLQLVGVLATSSVATADGVNSDFDFLEVYAATWNTHDADALAALFAADADMIMGNLPRVAGREAIRSWWQTYFSRIDAGRKGEFDLLSQRVIVPGVRLVNVASKTSGANDSGEELATRLARGTWLVVKEGGTWHIAAMRGLPVEGEERLRPGTDR